MKDLVKIETYKGIDLLFDKSNSHILFTYENIDMDVKYVFEAREIIDNPRWRECNLEGYFLDGIFNNYIGLAKASKIDKKSGKPKWEFKGQYDSIYKVSDFFRDKAKVYLKNKENDAVYRQWKEQHDLVQEEEQKERMIIKNLK